MFTDQHSGDTLLVFCATDSVVLRKVALCAPDGHRNRADEGGGITSDYMYYLVCVCLEI